MATKPVPLPIALLTCLPLLVTAVAMAMSSVALAGDGAFHLLRILETGDVFAPSARVLGFAVRQGPVLLAARAGVTDTHVLSVVLGLGQLVIPAVAWCLAIVLARPHVVVFAAVAMFAGLCAGTTWVFSTGESVIVAPLTVLVAVLLWRRRPWSWNDAVLAVASASILVAAYESAAATGLALGVWAFWRSTAAASNPDKWGSMAVTILSFLSVLVAVAGVVSGEKSTWAQSSLYFLVSGEPHQFYLGLVAMTAVLGAFAIQHRGVRLTLLAFGGVCVVLAAASPRTTPVEAFQARGGVMFALLLLVLLLWGLWIQARRPEAAGPGASSSITDWGFRPLLLVVPAFVGAMIIVAAKGTAAWSRSLDEFRAEVRRGSGVAEVDDVLPADRREVLWGWTSSSMSLLVRKDTASRILVDRTPSFVPFEPNDAHAQLAAEYTWGR